MPDQYNAAPDQYNLQSFPGAVVTQLQSDTSNVLLTDPSLMVYEAGHYVAAMNRWRRCRHICSTKSQQVYQTQILPILLGQRFVDFRYGIDQGGQVTWQPLETHYIVGVDADTRSLSSAAPGYRFIVETADLIYTLKFARRMGSHQGLISDLVQKLADSVNQSLPTNSKFTTVIESTSLQHKLIQAGESDYDYLLERLMPLAVNPQGNGNYTFYSVGDTLHFHTKGYGPGCNIHTLNYTAPAAKSGSYDLHHIDDAGSQEINGMFGVTTIAYDPRTGKTAQKPINPDAVKITANVMISTLETVPWVLGKHIGQNTAQSEFDGVQSHYETARSMSFGIRFKITNYPLLRIGDMINLQLESTANPLSGMYHVVGTITELKGNTSEIFVTCRRGTMLSSSLTNTTGAVSVMTGATIGGMPARGVLIPSTTGTANNPSGKNSTSVYSPLTGVGLGG